MNTNNSWHKLNLFEKSKVKLLIEHQENCAILETYLSEKYDVLTNSSEFKNDDIIIADEKGFGKYKEKIINIKQSNTTLFLPLILITRASIDEIPEKYMHIIDEIVRTPIQQSILSSRIHNLLNVRKLFLSTQIYQDLTEKNPVGICILSEDKRIKYTNQAFSNIINENREDILEKKVTDFINNKKFVNQLSKDILENKSELTVKLNLANQKKWVSILFSSIIYQDYNLKLLIVIDITEQKNSEKKIRYLRFHDQLTGVYNRDYFMEEIKRLDTKRQLPLSIIMGDINSLKLVNDVFGHDQGDILIKNISEILRYSVRDEDILARIGGDEFAILFPNTTIKTARAICKRINQRCLDFVGEGIVSIALGVATKMNINQDIDDILKAADDNMYQNKISESKKTKQKIISNINERLRKETDESQDHIIILTSLLGKFANKLNLNDSQKDKLKTLAEAHDIGKISVKKVILKSESQLTEKEREKLRAHTEYGYRISHSIPELSKISEEILSHHERWDGKGYPNGLKDNQIPFLARVFTIVDNYDLILNGRGFKNKSNKKKALEEIKKQAGYKYDPKLIKEFVEMMKN